MLIYKSKLEIEETNKIAAFAPYIVHVCITLLIPAMNLGATGFLRLKIVCVLRSELNCHSHRLVDSLFFRLEAVFVPDIIREFE